ncbi:MAG: succinate dehydrogenase [Clostridiales bacterium]|nr:succinate dehydrogenase [Clostridiales bacterium]
MILRILRFDSELDQASYYQEYDLPISSEDRFTVMDALNYIFNNLDSSLSFFSHSVCNHGICGRCLMIVDGKPSLACTHILGGEKVVIEPKKGTVIRDLVVK